MSPRRPWPHRLAHALVLGACAFFAWHGVHAGLREQGSDFSIYYAAGRAVLAGRSPLVVERYLYWPAFAVAIAPLALLPYVAALVLWQLGSLVALAWLAARCQRTCERELGVERPWLAWAPLACVLRLADSSLSNGQANLFVLALVLAGLDAWLRGREVRAGVWLGCASALKIVPLFLVLAFVARRGGRALLATCATALVIALPVSSLALGWDTNAAALGSWYQDEVQPYLRGGDALLAAHAYLPGQSLTAVAYRSLCDVPASSEDESGARANLAAMDPERVKWLVRGLELAGLLVLASALCLSVRSSARGARLRECALVVCGALALAPLVHKAHMVWLIVPYAVLLSGAPAESSPLARRLRWGLIGLSVFAIGATTPVLLGRTLASHALSHDTVFVGLVLVAAALLVDVWSTRARTAAAAEAS